MNFPYYKIQSNPRKLDNGKYKATCSISLHKGNEVIFLQQRWELKKEFDSKQAADRIMRFNALQFLRREYGIKDLEQVKLVVVS